ncbi:hypothetical protein [Prosthecochloris sp.]|uniref:hypothetical protein n=1 Tax=Prosthecochloris sp. TaxID=290513 RepID=UPI00258388E7|nr:hypothetical protein [Prosthecochloris sp.]
MPVVTMTTPGGDSLRGVMIIGIIVRSQSHSRSAERGNIAMIPLALIQIPLALSPSHTAYC